MGVLHFPTAHDDEANVLVEADDVDASMALGDVIDKMIVVLADGDAQLGLGEEGANDRLRGLLGELVAVDCEACIVEQGGDEVAAGNGLGARLGGGAVEIPGGAEPAVHHFR